MRWLFVNGKGLKYELRGKDADKMTRHLVSEGITPANGWRPL